MGLVSFIVHLLSIFDFDMQLVLSVIGRFCVTVIKFVSNRNMSVCDAFFM